MKTSYSFSWSIKILPIGKFVFLLTYIRTIPFQMDSGFIGWRAFLKQRKHKTTVWSMPSGRKTNHNARLSNAESIRFNNLPFMPVTSVYSFALPDSCRDFLTTWISLSSPASSQRPLHFLHISILT